MEDGKAGREVRGMDVRGMMLKTDFSHFPDYHSPDFAVDNVFKRVGGLKILAQTRDSDGAQYKEEKAFARRWTHPPSPRLRRGKDGRR
jgi:hypothetical protein